MGIIAGMLLGCLLAVFIYQWALHHKLMSYLKSAYPERWRYLTTLGKYGPGCRNDVRNLLYRFSSDEMEDPIVAQYKRKLRVAMIAIPVLFCCFAIADSFL